MSAGSLFKIPRLGRYQPAISEDFYHTLLELVPHPVLLIDTQKQVILSANSKCTELSAYTRAELTDLHLDSFFKNWSQSNLSSTALNTNIIDPPDKTTELYIINRNQQRLPVSASRIDIDPENDRALIVCQSQTSLFLEQSLDSQLWKSVRILLSSLNEDEFNQAINHALKASLELVGGETAVYYQTLDDRPELNISFQVGENLELPERLPLQDLAMLSDTAIWIPGKRTTTTLTRFVRTAQVKYLLTTAVGQPNALIGLVAISGNRTTPGKSALIWVDLLGQIITAILQKHAQIDLLRSELAIQELRDTVNTILQENMSEGYLLLNTNLEVKDLNQATELMLGYSIGEIAGQPIEKILIADQKLEHTFESALNASPTYSLNNLHLYRRNGEAFRAHIRVFPVIHQDQVSEVIIYIQDLSEQERMRRQAQEFEQRAMLGEVTAIFAHEIRNPINNISTGLQLMAYNLPDDDENQESIQRMLQDCDRLAELIKAVLSFSRPTDYEMETLDITKLMERLLQRLQTRIKQSNINFELKSDPDLPEVYGNQRALEQVFSNLILNAMQAMEAEGGHLGIKIGLNQESTDRVSIEVSVADTGPGIPEDMQERIFQPFVTTKRGGTGLGLAISKRIITAHKGNLRVNSFPGGTVFTAIIPAQEPYQ